MRRDWKSGAGLICQAEDEMLGWRRRREGKREERVHPRDEGIRGIRRAAERGAITDLCAAAWNQSGSRPTLSVISLCHRL